MPHTNNPSQNSSRVLVACLVCAAVGMIELAVWSSEVIWRVTGIAFAVALLSSCVVLVHSSWRDPMTERRMPRWVGRAVVFGSCILIIGTAVVFERLNFWSPSQLVGLQRSTFDWLAIKIPTVIVQQVVFQLAVIPAVYFSTRNVTATAIISALLFSLLHLPNPVLMVLTLVAGLVWFGLTVRRPMLITMTASHLILAVGVANIAEDFVLDMRVGPLCFQKWPESIQAADGTKLVVVPRLLEGRITRVSQIGEVITVEGVVHDPFQRRAPTEVVVGFADARDELRSPKRPTAAILESGDDATVSRPTWEPATFHTVHPNPRTGEFKLQVKSQDSTKQAVLRLFAGYGHGWSFPVHHTVLYDGLEVDPTGREIQLYPRRFRGYVGHVIPRSRRTDVVGWAYSEVDGSFLDRLYVFRGGEMDSLEIARRPRKEIIDLHGNPNLLNCGFSARLPRSAANLDLKFYVQVDGHWERLPRYQPQRLKQTALKQTGVERTAVQYREKMR